MRRLSCLLLLAAVVVGLLGPARPAAASPTAPADDERVLLDLANRDRAAAGLAPLTMGGSLLNYARSHAQTMAEAGSIFHTADLAGTANSIAPNWTRVAENVGRGGSASALHAALMASPTHRTNLLGDYNVVGMGVVWKDGTLYLTQFFAKSTGVVAVSAGSTPPIGSLDAVTRVPGGLAVSGWTLDPDTAAPIAAHAYMDVTNVGAFTADAPRADVAGAFPGYGPAHGVQATVPAVPGRHAVCLYGINDAAGANPRLGCAVVDVAVDPMGALDLAQPVAGGIRVAGWALDPDTAAPLQVHVYVDGQYDGVRTAGGARPDIAAFAPAYGPTRGYDAIVPAGPGPHSVCAYGINQGAGTNTLLGCRSI